MPYRKKSSHKKIDGDDIILGHLKRISELATESQFAMIDEQGNVIKIEKTTIRERLQDSILMLYYFIKPMVTEHEKADINNIDNKKKDLNTFEDHMELLQTMITELQKMGKYTTFGATDVV